MVTKKQVLGFSILFAACVILISFPTWFGNFLSEKFGAEFVIKEIDDLDAEDFSVKGLHITNAARPVYIFPYDDLSYHAVITNKLPYQVIVKCLLEKDSGDSHSVIADISIPINAHQSGVFLQKFSTTHEGYHKVKLTLSLYNSTDDFNSVVTPLEQKSKSTKLDVLSLNDKILIEQNWYLLIGLGISSAIGLITAKAVINERKIAEAQTAELKTQNKHLGIQNDNFKEQSEKEYNLIKGEQKRNLLFKVFELLSSIEQRKLREEIFQEHCKYHLYGKKIDGEAKFIPENKLKQKADHVIAPFDQIGIFINTGLLDEKLFFEIYGGMVTRTWIALEDYIDSKREEFAKNFRILNEKAVKYFRSNNEEIPQPHCDDVDPYKTILDDRKYVDPENKK